MMDAFPDRNDEQYQEKLMRMMSYTMKKTGRQGWFIDGGGFLLDVTTLMKTINISRATEVVACKCLLLPRERGARSLPPDLVQMKLVFVFCLLFSFFSYSLSTRMKFIGFIYGHSRSRDSRLRERYLVLSAQYLRNYFFSSFTRVNLLSRCRKSPANHGPNSLSSRPTSSDCQSDTYISCLHHHTHCTYTADSIHTWNSFH